MFAFAHNETSYLLGIRAEGTQVMGHKMGDDDAKTSQFTPFDITFIILITYITHYNY